MKISGVLETCLYVDDLAAAEAFYRDVLRLELVSVVEGRHVFLRCGKQMLLLFDPRETSKSDGDLPPHGTTGSGHIAFAIPADQLDDWQRQLANADVRIEHEETWPNGQRSLYFRDPAGNSLELTSPQIWGL